MAMKTYILSIPERLKMKSAELDAKAVLCGKSWTLFNDEGQKQVFIFQADGSLLVALNGNVTKSHWSIIPENGSIIISENDSNGTMFHPIFLDKVVFALQQDGTNSSLFMIDESVSDSFRPKTLTELSFYFSQVDKLLTYPVSSVPEKPKASADPKDYTPPYGTSNSTPGYRTSAASSARNNGKIDSQNKDIWVGLFFIVALVFAILFFYKDGSYKSLLENYDSVLKSEKELRDANFKLDFDKKLLYTTYPILISEIEIGNFDYNNNALTDYGKTIFSSDTKYLKPRIKYMGFNSGQIVLNIKLYNSYGYMSSGTSSPNGFSYSTTLKVNPGSSMVELPSWGSNTKGHWPAGKYRYEIWYEDVCLKSKSFTVY